jgi:hypothetical protein
MHGNRMAVSTERRRLALVLALVDQPSGSKSFNKFLNALANDPRSERDLLNARQIEAFAKALGVPLIKWRLPVNFKYNEDDGDEPYSKVSCWLLMAEWGREHFWRGDACTIQPNSTFPN